MSVQDGLASRFCSGRQTNGYCIRDLPLLIGWICFPKLFDGCQCVRKVPSFILSEKTT
jgi:hypothetical protein